MNTSLGKSLPAVLACLFLSVSVAAQEESFDLSSQRSEKQTVTPVSGHRLEHGGIILNPTPQEAAFNTGRRLNIASGVKVRDRNGRFGNDLGFLPSGPGKTILGIDFGSGVSAAHGVRQVPGAYSLSISKKGIFITGYDEQGAFYGIQTLRQLLESPASKDGRLPYAEINDWPDLPSRGVVEGFYGTPWSREVRLSLIDFYGRFKMNTYLYGPKDDPYHSCPDWRKPYPEKEAAEIRDLVAACVRNRVDFVWAIHPGQDIKWNEEDYRNLVDKFNWMYGLGVRNFAIFFDDISGDGTNPLRQTELLNRLTEEFVKPKGDVGPLTVCPTDYSRLWANPNPDGALAIYGKTLNPEIKVFWTGDVVCSDLTRETTEFVNRLIRRPAYYWWNYPVTDYARNYLLQGPVYGLDTTLGCSDVCGVVSNPMEYGEASRLALYGVADYTWNISAYNPLDNWERGLAELMPDAAQAYRTFAIHSCDTETGYRRDESWETETFRLADWSDEAAEALEEEFRKIEEVPAQIEKACSDRLLLAELRPWLEEFGKLGTRGRKVIGAARLYRSGADPAEFWESYAGCLMSQEQRQSFELHKSGTMKLQPFYENMMDDMASGFLEKLSGKLPADYRGISSFDNSGTVLPKLMLDRDCSTYYTSGMSQRANDWIGVDLKSVQDVREVAIRQGRNSVDDVDYFDHALLECSSDGLHWTVLLDELVKQYDIHWEGAPVKARYVRLRRLDSQRSNYASVRTFDVNPTRLEKLGFAVSADGSDRLVDMFDNSARTFCTLSAEQSLSMEIPAGTSDCTILAGTLTSPLVCRIYDAGGNLLRERTLSAAYSAIDLPEAAASLTLDGTADIYEIVLHGSR